MENNFLNFDISVVSTVALADILQEVKSSRFSCEKRCLREYLDYQELCLAEKVLSAEFERRKKESIWSESEEILK